MNDIQEIEGYISGTMPQHRIVVFEGRLRRDPLLRMNVGLQRKVMALLSIYNRKKLKMQLEEVHEKIFSDPMKLSWREKVLRLFDDD